MVRTPAHTDTRIHPRECIFCTRFLLSSLAPRPPPLRLTDAQRPKFISGARGGKRMAHRARGGPDFRAWGHLPDDRQKARTEEDRGGESGCGGCGGRRWAVAAALLLVPELVGGGDWERARSRESAFPRPAGGAGASHGSATLARGGAGSEACGAPPPPATRGRARATRSPPSPSPRRQASPSSSLPFPGPATPRASALTATRTRVLHGARAPRPPGAAAFV